jgi:predicted RNase H-like HicB family nuclease
MQAYSDPKRTNDPHSLPDVEVFQLTDTETAAQDEELIYEYSKRPEFRLRHMNSRTQEAILDAIVEEEGITGGWYWWTCLPGCLPDSCAFGPFDTRAEALADAQEAQENADEDEDEDEDEDA